MDIEGARSRIHGPAAELPVLGLGEPESTYSWTGTTCRAAPLACSDWSEERDVGRSLLDRVEGDGDNGKPGRAGRHPRIAVTGVLISAVGAPVITPRGRSTFITDRAVTRGPISDPVTMDDYDCTITFDTPTASLLQATYGFRHPLLSVWTILIVRNIFGRVR